MPDFRYDENNGVLWLDGDYAVDIVYDSLQRCWLIGPDGSVGKKANAAEALAKGREYLTAAAADDQSHIAAARQDMTNALAAASIPTGAPVDDE